MQCKRGARFVVTKDLLELINLTKFIGGTTSVEVDRFRIKIDIEHKPKRLTLTGPQRDGVIAILEGIYMIDGDKLTLTIGSVGRIPLNFGEQVETASLTVELEREIP